MACFSCGGTIELAAGERVGFRDTCDSCDADRHTCLNCAHHDPGAYNECRESNAEWVSDRERANRCEYFVLGGGGGGDGAERETALSQLDGLFKKS